MLGLPIEPHESLAPFAPEATRTLTVLGATVQLALVPGRSVRSGHVREGRPALQRSPAGRILKAEAYWRSESLALTPNKYPFATNQRILWMAQPSREPDRTFWRALLGWVEESGGTALHNNVGAAATIPRAHAHLIDEQLPFLTELPERKLTAELIDVPDGCELVCKDVPFCLIGVRGGAAAKAEAMMLLADARLTATWNVIATGSTTWIVPRGKQTPAPHFDQAVGAAEIWGRWCFVDREPFERTTAEDLERALVIATAAAID